MKISHPYRATLVKLALLCLFILSLPVQSMARDVIFQWTANAGTVTGYKLYYVAGTNISPPFKGTGLTAGNSPIAVGKVTTYTLTGLSPDQTYHFALTAYNQTEESVYSTIVTVEPSLSPSPVIINISMKQ